MNDEIPVGSIEPIDQISTDDMILVWMKNLRVLRLLPSGKFAQETDIGSGVKALAGIVKAKGMQPENQADPLTLKSLNGAIITLNGDGSVSIVAGTTVANPTKKITIGDAGTVLTLAGTAIADLLRKSVADTYYLMRHPVTNGPSNIVDGMALKLAGSWMPAGAKEEWIGVAQNTTGTTAKNFNVVSGGKVFIPKALFATWSTPPAQGDPKGSTATIGESYWWTGSQWENKEPSDWDSFKGKVVVVGSNTSANVEAIALPFKRRSGFRPAASSPFGAGTTSVVGKITAIFRSPNLPAKTLLAGVQKGSSTSALFKSVDDGNNWTPILNFPTGSTGGFDSLNDIILGPAGKVLIAFGFKADLTSGSSRDWIYAAPQTLASPFVKESTAWGSVGKNLMAIAYDGAYTLAPLVVKATNNNVYRSPSGKVDSFTGYGQLASSNPKDTMVFGGQVYFANNSSIHKSPLVSGSFPVMSGATFPGETLVRLDYNTANNKSVVVATQGGNIYRTDDFTAATPVWSAAIKPGRVSSTDAGKVTTINDMAFSDGVWYLATNDGIYRSGDDGKAWTKMFDNDGVSMTAVAAEGIKVWAGDENGKIYRYGM